ncbi:MAG: hypothetical protein K2N26_05770, partial [Oscillospiraceae bacterium]|nr:hypothetical protein [Oscillospiraceae bacterium]
DPFFESAKVSVRLENIGGPDPKLTSQFYGFYDDDYAVTINFTVKNTGDEKIKFVPHRFYVKLKDGGVLSPRVADDGFFSYGDPNNPWYGMHIPAGEQVSFSVTYYVSEQNASQIKCFAYNVYNNYYDDIHLYADIADEDGYVSQQIAFEIEKLKNGGKETLP